MEKIDELEKIYQLLFDSAAEGLLVVDGKGVIKISNPRAEEMFGYTKVELLGKSVDDLVPDQHRRDHHKHREKYAREPVKRTMGLGMDLTGRRNDGSVFPVEIALNYVKMNDDVLVMALITDITERKRTDDELKHLNLELEERVKERTRELEQSQKLYSVIARNFPNGSINVLDKNLDYVFVEGMELFRLGITGDKLIGTNYLTRIDSEIREEIGHKLAQVFEGQNTLFEIEHNNNIYSLNAVGLYNANGDVDQILVVEQNITKQKRAENDMVAALEKEQQLNELKSRFVSMASHEFRTPLSTVLSSVSLLGKYVEAKDEDKRLKHIARIKSSVNNLTGILNDFLSLDKLEEGKVSSHPEDVQIGELCEEIMEELQQSSDKNSIEYTHTGPDEVLVDRQMMKNILINLLSNAIKYSKEGKSIELKTSVSDAGFSVTVEDQGIGIPKEDQQHLFERFFRARNSTNLQGTGLGLNIVKKYVEFMQGTVSYKSEEGVGSTFIVKIPQPKKS